MINITDKEKEIVKGTIRSIVDDRLSQMIGYDFDGSDFTERLMNELPIDEDLSSFDRIVQGETTQFIDNELYHKFVDNLTDSIFNDLKFE